MVLRKLLSLCAVLLVAVSAAAGPTSETPQAISDVACLRKLALDLTHRSPSAEELSRLTSKTATFGQLADEYLASPEFSEVVFDWYRREFPPTGITPPGTDTEEPARIARYVVTQNRDLRELLTGTYTVDAAGKVVEQTGKPVAGLLSTKHYMTAALGLLRRNWAGRYQRQWTGITLQAVSIPDGAPVDTSREGLATNPECKGCHVHPEYGIDFLARFVDCWKDDGSFDASCKPAEGTFLGGRGLGLPELGRITVGTGEWRAHMVNFYFRQLFGRGLATTELDYYLDAKKVLEASGFQAKPLIKHLVTTPAYCAR